MNKTSYRTQHPQTSRGRPYRRTSGKPFLAVGGIMFLSLGLLFPQVGKHSTSGSSGQGLQYDACEDMASEEARLSREQLAKFLTISNRDTKAKVREAIGEPYCTLPPIEVREGAPAEREVHVYEPDAYWLAFDPGKTILIVLYEGDEYAGYQFDFDSTL